MSTEYDQYSIEELYEMTRGDDPDAMEKQAQGWSNSAALYKSKYENMQKHFEAIRTSWTSASAEPYLKHIAFTARALETAWVDSNMKANGLAEMATVVRNTKDDVAEQYKQWIEVRDKARNSYAAAMKNTKKSLAPCSTT